MKRVGYEVQASACILVQTVEPQSRGLDHGHIVLGLATKVEKAFARFIVEGLARASKQRGGGALDPAGSSRPRAPVVSGVHETVEGVLVRWLTRKSHPPAPRKGWWAA
jgi:hypothetical protein